MSMKNNLLMKHYLGMGKKRSGKDSDMGYVKDGLVFHLDGINKGDDPLAWTDLIQGIKFAYNDCILNTNNVEFNGKSSYAVNSTDLDKLKFPYQTHTLEVCYKTNNKYWYSILMIPINGNLIYSVGGGALTVFNVSERYLDINSFINNKHIFCSYSNPNNPIILNKTEKHWSSEYSVWMSDVKDSYIGKGCFKQGTYIQNSFLRGNIYSIRVYNKILTKEEMLANQQVDIDRFFNGVIPQ